MYTSNTVLDLASTVRLPSAPESVKYGSETCESQSLQFELKYQYRVPLFTIYSCSVEI